MTVPQRKLSIGFSPCPNDTFIFHALMHGKVETAPLLFDREILADVETLNEWALRAKLDVTKLSFHALGHVLDEYVLLNAGSALGRGCGPLLVASHRFDSKDLIGKRVAIPGKYTTAAMLLRLFLPDCGTMVPMRFDEIMAAITNGVVDAGVIIHESRFTYRNYGLELVQDLGSWWETVSGHPIPLGGIAARRSLGPDSIAAIDRCVRASVRRAFAAPDEGMAYVKQHAQEMDDKVIRDHIGLYVNSFSEDLGREGRAAIAEFLERGRTVGLFTRGGDIRFA